MEARVLVIDDEEGIRFAFERFIRGAGHQVETAGTFQEGLDRIARSDFDLIFADIILGAQSGVEILREVKARNLKCPLVFITGYPTIETASEAVRLGAFDYLPKPVHKESLLRVMKLALLHKSELDEKERHRSNIEAVFKSAKDVIVTVDKDFLLVELNKAAENFYGLSRDSIGKPFSFFLGRCKGLCVEMLKTAVQTGQAVERCRMECSFPGKPGRVIDLLTTPIYDDRGEPSGAVIAVRDETRRVETQHGLGKLHRYHDIVGCNERMSRIYTLIDHLADVQSSVLITGESGTGKELVAEALHHGGERRNKPLVKVNCSALSENLLESELFGHVKGAFTGAVKDKIGRFQMAHGGTLFLDEIGDISSAVQQRLLRVLQEREFERVGDSRPVKVDVRIVAATNKDLHAKMAKGEFRSDLYYRLKVVEIALPPLRERREDIPLLVQHFIEKLNTKLKTVVEGVSEDVLTAFMAHPWPGNVRQLEHTIEHALILCPQNIITRDHLPPDFEEATTSTALSKANPSNRDEEIPLLLEALKKTSWNKAKAARLLGMSRRTIYRKIESHGIMQPSVEEL